MSDSADEQLARKIAREIERYWRSRGYPDVKASVERVAVSAGEGTFAIVSNLKNGLPERFRGF